MSGWKGAGMDAGAGSLCKRLAFTGSTAVEKMVQTRHSLIKEERSAYQSVCKSDKKMKALMLIMRSTFRNDAMSRIAQDFLIK